LLLLWNWRYLWKAGGEEAEEVVEGLKHFEKIIEARILNNAENSAK
jgi:hypothetical protein